MRGPFIAAPTPTARWPRETLMLWRRSEPDWPALCRLACGRAIETQQQRLTTANSRCSRCHAARLMAHDRITAA
jgi:hypothetical protein